MQLEGYEVPCNKIQFATSCAYYCVTYIHMYVCLEFVKESRCSKEAFELMVDGIFRA